MNLKNFIKKKFEKDNTRFLVRNLVNGLYESEYMSLTKISNYLKKNEIKIGRITITLLKSN